MKYRMLRGFPSRMWTRAAIECYSIGCNCSKCELIKELESVNPYTCRMKSAVIELVRKLGKPEIIKKEDVIDDR